MLVEAAREAFAEEGLQVSLDRIARRAGVGSATLYRHFPQRRELVDEVFSSTLTEVTTAGDRAVAARSAWTGLTEYLYAVFANLPTERSAADSTLPHPQGATTVDLIHERHRRTVHTLLLRGQKQGTVRPDMTTEDLLLALAVLGRALPALITTAGPGSWHRPLALLLDASRAHPAAFRLPTPSFTEDELDKILGS
ncbi:TetR/AcrR family transcriptional regulator [Streptomyces sp. NPDC059906]|uniref:TetR/AcrR family transcriptional regulator n=1 Tax=Streptomyces sp. NPDC059906 TaxID=3346997 RepID=UPI00366693ED